MNKVKQFIFINVVLLVTCLITNAQDTVCLDGNSEGRIFEGICGVNAGGGVGRLLINYPEPQRIEILDYLFKPNYGASVHAYKAEIGGDGNSTEGSEPSHMHTADDQNYNRGYQWWMMEEAKKRNPDIKLMVLAWDFPAWIKSVCSQTAADYLVNYIKGAKKEHNLDIDYIGMWNETKTCNKLAILLRKTLDANGLQRVKIMADDQVRNWAIADSLKADKELFNSIDIVTTHYPKYESTRQAKDIGKPIWSSEDGPWGDEWGVSGQQSGPLAKNLNLNYIKGKMTSTQIWNIITAYYDILDVPYAGLLRAMTPWSGHYEVMSPLWVTAHTTQFAKPGWKYIDQACVLLKNGGSLVTLKKDKDYSIIIETLDALEKQTISCNISGGLSTGKLFVWKTDSARYFEKVAEITPVNGSFSFSVDKNSLYSLTTTKGQGKGNATGPADQQFSLPYRDDFEQYNVGFTCVKFFIEQNGAYEVVPAGYGRTGKALRQVVSQSPIVWTYGNTAYLLGTASIIGDKNWNNYTVSSDILLEEPGYARVMGRVSRATLDGQINGYQLYIYDNGDWKMKYSTTGAALDSGKAECGLKKWHNLKMSFNKNIISSFIDNKKVSEVTDNRFFSGMAGIGNYYNKGLYDIFEIAPVPGTELYSKESGNKGYFFDKIPESPYMHTCMPLKNAVKISWDPAYGAKGYKIKFGTKRDELTSVTNVGNLTSYTIWTLKTGQRYYFNVTAYNDKGESKPSGTESAEVR